MPFLRFLARNGTRFSALSVLVGVLMPPASGALKPMVAPAIVLLLTLALLRVEPAALRAAFGAPRRLLAPLLVMMVLTPLGFILALHAIGPGRIDAGIMIGIMIYASTSPLLSAPAFAGLMGLDAALTLAMLLSAMAVVAFTAPIMMSLSGVDLPSLSTFELLLRLVLIVGGAALVARLVRWVMGAQWVRAHSADFDGVAVILLFLFAVAVLDGVGLRLLHDPLRILAITALCFALSLGMIAIGTLLFRRRGPVEALSLGLVIGNRNMGLIIAAVGSAAPDSAWLYVALCQFPIYLLPWILKPLADRAVRRQGLGHDLVTKSG